MRIALVASFALLVVGCAEHVDPTMNRTGDPADQVDYPAGPYGYIEGSTVENYNFLGKQPPLTGANLAANLMEKLDLSQFHNDPNVKLLLVEGSANWCYWCNQEAPDVKRIAEKYESQGFKVLNALAEGDRGVPATEADVNQWINRYEMKFAVGIDPENRMQQYGDVSAFPLHLIIRTSDMTIQYMYIGGKAPLEENIVQLLGQ